MDQSDSGLGDRRLLYRSLSDPVLPGSPVIALSRIVHYQVSTFACICMNRILHMFSCEHDLVYSIVPSGPVS